MRLRPLFLLLIVSLCPTSTIARVTEGTGITTGTPAFPRPPILALGNGRSFSPARRPVHACIASYPCLVTIVATTTTTAPSSSSFPFEAGDPNPFFIDRQVETITNITDDNSKATVEANIDNNINNKNNNIRLNKLLTVTHSRRQADALIRAGRVAVNGRLASLGVRVSSRDIVTLQQVDDGEWITVDTTFTTPITTPTTNSSLNTQRQHDYVKYWKPIGVTCTCDPRIPGNLVEALALMNDRNQTRRRLFPVGRLDKDTSGLLLLTSDGDLPNAALRSTFGQTKTYLVTTDRPVQARHVSQLEAGVLITTETTRRVSATASSSSLSSSSSTSQSSDHSIDRATRYRRTPITSLTLPARAVVISHQELALTLTEGRNRQIRKMFTALGYRVVKLHRTHFLGIDLSNLHSPGDWKALSETEIKKILPP